MRRAAFQVAVALLLVACGDDPDAPPADSAPSAAAPQTQAAAYVDETQCAGCHPQAAEAWRGSHHDLAMQQAGAHSVLGDFDDAVFESRGRTVRFHRRGDAYLVETEGADGERRDFEVSHVFGVEPLQQLLLPLPDGTGRVQAFDVAWDTTAERWFELELEADDAPGEPFHWTGPYLRWNAMCADCHSTAVRKRYDPETDRYDTQYEREDVGCQACHGPGAAHLRWAEAAGAAAEPGGEASGAVYPGDRSGAGSRDEVDLCAPCHSRRHRVAPEAQAGAPFMDGHAPATLRRGLYHADGQILDEVYVYGSFLQSRMYAAGVRCSDCHDPHGLSLRAEGNALCTSCHSESPDPRFPGLRAKRYDAASHHRHAEGSEGSQCVACHMPERTYMQVDPRRDHGLRVPRPDLAEALGVPEPCTGCHAEHDAAWAAEQLRAWRGGIAPPRHAFADVLSAARRDPLAQEAELAALLRSELPGIVRATALEMLAPREPASQEALVQAVRDPDPLVRMSVGQALMPLPAEQRQQLLAPLLDDPLRAVRVEAARMLADVAPASPELAAAREELHAAIRADLDLPAGWMNLGMQHSARGALAEAAKAFDRALQLDPGLQPARLNLAIHYERLGWTEDAERVLRAGLERQPDELQWSESLGLLLGRDGRLEEATVLLERAASDPARSRVPYNLGLVLQRQGRLEEAEQALDEAARRNPDDPQVIHARALLALEQGDLEAAREWSGRLSAAAPGSRAEAALQEQLRQAELTRSGNPAGR